jgi:hypothetical protein
MSYSVSRTGSGGFFVQLDFRSEPSAAPIQHAIPLYVSGDIFDAEIDGKFYGGKDGSLIADETAKAAVEQSVKGREINIPKLIMNGILPLKKYTEICIFKLKRDREHPENARWRKRFYRDFFRIELVEPGNPWRLAALSIMVPGLRSTPELQTFVEQATNDLFPPELSSLGVSRGRQGRESLR